MSSQETKNLIASTFMDLALEKRDTDVSTSALCKACNVSRMTFYYHFPDRACLIWWIYRDGLAYALQQELPEKVLVRPVEGSRDLFATLPYYARIPSGIRTLNQAAFFDIFTAYLQKRSDLFKLVLKGDQSEGFIRSFYGLYHQAIWGDVKIILGGRKLPDNVIKQLTYYYTHAIFSPFVNSLQYFCVQPKDILPSQFENLGHEALCKVIEGYFSGSDQEYRFF